MNSEKLDIVSLTTTAKFMQLMQSSAPESHTDIQCHMSVLGKPGITHSPKHGIPTFISFLVSFPQAWTKTWMNLSADIE